MSKPVQPRHPGMDLMARYKAIFISAWAQRAELAGPARLADEAAFLPAALSLQETPVHPAPRRLAWGLMILFVLALVWSVLGQLDIVAVAQGRVVVSERTKVIQPLERSVVQRVLVKDGDQVQAGQPLIELDPTAAVADKATAGEQLKANESELLRTRTLLAALQSKPLLNNELLAPVSIAPGADLAINLPASWPPADQLAAKDQLAAEWGDITAKLAKLASEANRRQAEITTAREVVAKLETTVPLAQQREADFKKLAEQGFMAGHAGQDRTRERIELERDLSTQRARLQEAIATLRETQNARTAYVAEVRRTL